jgi:hypothetical protein
MALRHVRLGLHSGSELRVVDDSGVVQLVELGGPTNAAVVVGATDIDASATAAAASTAFPDAAATVAGSIAIVAAAAAVSTSPMAYTPADG